MAAAWPDAFGKTTRNLKNLLDGSSTLLPIVVLMFFDNDIDINPPAQ